MGGGGGGGGAHPFPKTRGDTGLKNNFLDPGGL